MRGGIVAALVFESPLGKLSLALSGQGLHRLSFVSTLNESFGSHPSLERLMCELERYFDGEKIEFKDIKIDLAGYTEFEKRVLRATRRIPYGETASYREIARSIGRPKAYRAVGNALNKNRTSIVIPCHRIIRSDGSLGGFGVDIKTKKALLMLEGII